MMDLNDIKRQALAAREFVHTVGGARHITLRAPTQHEVTLAARRSGLHTAQDDAAAHIVLQRMLLLLAVVGWSGLLVADVLTGHADAAELLAYDPAAVELLLDAQPGWATELSDALMQRMQARRQTQDTAEKNSQS